MGGKGSGGSRAGAGRKSLDGAPREKLSISLPVWIADLVRVEAARRHVAASQLITELLTKGLGS